MDWNMSTASRTLAQEVRGEPPEAQAAVAHVIKNRLLSSRWGKTLASVCLWHGQFSGWFIASDPNFSFACGLRDDDPLLIKMAGVMQAAMDSGADPTNGATHYCNLSIVAKPAWIDGDRAKGIPPATVCGKIGHHTFFKNVR